MCGLLAPALVLHVPDVWVQKLVLRASAGLWRGLCQMVMSGFFSKGALAAAGSALHVSTAVYLYLCWQVLLVTCSLVTATLQELGPPKW